MKCSRGEYVRLSVEPKGRLLNDNIGEVDYLQHTVYAQALAQQIKLSTCPVTIAIFAKWGSGKSFLLKQIESLLRSYTSNAQPIKPRRWT
uniref:KAP NTPase domain-containing protein n=1 Tax=Ciona intestinalis TaxID=7719 RepID=H2XXI1_CIOIN